MRDSLYNEPSSDNVGGGRSAISEDIEMDIANIMSNLPEKE